MDYSKDFPLFLKVSALVFYFVSALVIFLKKKQKTDGPGRETLSRESSRDGWDEQREM